MNSSCLLISVGPSQGVHKFYWFLVLILLIWKIPHYKKLNIVGFIDIDFILKSRRHGVLWKLFLFTGDSISYFEKKNPADDQYCLACEIMLLSKDFITFPFVQCTFSAYPSAIQGRSKLKDEIIDITLKMPLSWRSYELPAAPLFVVSHYTHRFW